MALSKKAQKALEILKAGGRFETALRRAYTGGEKQAYWLETKDGLPVKGFSTVTFYELEDAGLLRRDMETLYGSTCHRTYYAVEAAS